MGKFTFNLSSASKSVDAAAGAALSSSTRNEDLTYSGNDTIVWDRINGERLRRGLPGLTNIGSPRPPPDPNESTVVPSNRPSEVFEVKGPPGLTLEQARAAFDQQAKTGSLVGLKPGSVLSAATQAAAGLLGAQTILSQAQSGITGALGAGIPGAAGAVGSISRAIGAAGGSLNGVVSENSSGLSGAVGGVIAEGATAAAAVAKVGSVATTAINTVNRTLAGTPLTAPVDLVNYAKQAEALTSIGSMSQSTVTSVLAQTKNLVGQDSSTVSSKGVGAYGFDVSQLEKAGVVKPGVSQSFTAAGPPTITQEDRDEAAKINSEGGDVTPDQVAQNRKLNSYLTPAVFTGKDGIKSTGDILSNPIKQDQIQQQLMSQGVNQLAAVGVPVNALNAEGLAGLATNAAKSVAGTEALLKNLPTPTGVPAEFTETFNKNVRDGAFAAKFSETKVPVAFKAEIVPPVAEQTVQRPTVDAASTRVIGNDKVPEPTYTAKPAEEDADTVDGTFVLEQLDAWSKIANRTQQRIEALKQQVAALENQETITQQQWDTVREELVQLRREFNTQAVPIFGAAADRYNAGSERLRRALQTRVFDARGFTANILIPAAGDLKQRIDTLKNKIAGTTTA
jgi:HAMP domain-containing protein